MSRYTAMSWLKPARDEAEKDVLTAPYHRFVVALLSRAWRDATRSDDTIERHRARLWLRSPEAAELCDAIGLNPHTIRAKLDTLADDGVFHSS